MWLNAYQSSTPQAAEDANKAVDGNPATCSRTSPEPTPWLTIDLGGTYAVAGMRITVPGQRYPSESKRPRLSAYGVAQDRQLSMWSGLCMHVVVCSTRSSKLLVISSCAQQWLHAAWEITAACALLRSPCMSCHNELVCGGACCEACSEGGH